MQYLRLTTIDSRIQSVVVAIQNATGSPTTVLPRHTIETISGSADEDQGRAIAAHQSETETGSTVAMLPNLRVPAAWRVVHDLSDPDQIRDEAQQLTLSERAGNEDVGLERTELLTMHGAGPTRCTGMLNHKNEESAEDSDDEEISYVILVYQYMNICSSLIRHIHFPFQKTLFSAGNVLNVSRR